MRRLALIPALLLLAGCWTPVEPECELLDQRTVNGLNQAVYYCPPGATVPQP